MSGPERFPGPGPDALPPCAGLVRRGLATLADIMVFGGLSTLLFAPLVGRLVGHDLESTLDALATASTDPVWVGHASGTLGLWVALWWLYFAVGWGLLGATPGKWLLGLRVVDHRTRCPIGVARALLRLVAYMVSSSSLGLGHLLMVVRSDHRALHDVLAGTRVVCVRTLRACAPPRAPTDGGTLPTAATVSGERAIADRRAPAAATSPANERRLPMDRFELPDLPYSYDALEPHYDAQTLELHHAKHHLGYVNGLNRALEQLAEARAAGAFGAIKGLERELAFHGGGHVLHSVFWTNLCPGGGGRPEGRLATAVARDFGSFEAFDRQLRAAANAVEGSGWGILAADANSARLLVLAVEKHQNQLLPGAVPLLVVDVWEHAYYLKYQNRRAEFVDALLDHLVNWDDVARRYDAVAGG